jgi:hypothetical protein
MGALPVRGGVPGLNSVCIAFAASRRRRPVVAVDFTPPAASGALVAITGGVAGLYCLESESGLTGNGAGTATDRAPPTPRVTGGACVSIWGDDGGDDRGAGDVLLS